MPPAVRLSDKAACPADKHGCPACPHPTFGPAVNGSPDVFINKLAAIRLGDPGIHMACCGPNQWKVDKGSSTVYVNGKPLARMGDATKHCGGDGKLIVGSPNVFADDGALSALKAKLQSLKDLETRGPHEGSYEGKDDKKSGNWQSKEGKGGKGKNNQGGKNAGDKGAGGGDEDLSRDVGEGGQDTGGLLRSKVTNKNLVFAPGQEIKFTVFLAKDCPPGAITVQLVDKRTEETFKTSVTPKKQGAADVKGTILAPKMKKDDRGNDVPRDLELRAVKGKAAPVPAPEEIKVVGGDTVFLQLYVEQRGPGEEGDEPTNERPESTELYESSVQATVTINTRGGPKKFDVTFQKGYAAIAPLPGDLPEANLPKAEPADGKAYGPDVVDVKFANAQFKDWKVRAFAPPTQSKKKK